jgi:hypothetical protein
VIAIGDRGANMIVSQIFMPVRNDRWTAFEIVLTNLEAVPLRFRFTYAITKAQGLAFDAQQILRDRLKVRGVAGVIPTELNWTRVDGTTPVGYTSAYRAAAEITVPPGITHGHALVFHDAFGTNQGDNTGLLGYPFQVLRGHWEISLPLVTIGRPPKRVPAIDHPARVAVLVVYHSLDNGAASSVDMQNIVPIPTLDGRAEAFVPPDQPPPAAAPKRPQRKRG